MKLPFIILSRSRAESIDQTTNEMRKMLATDIEHLQLALNVITCQEETLEQYELALAQTILERNVLKDNNIRLANAISGLHQRPAEPDRTREEASTCSDI